MPSLKSLILALGACTLAALPGLAQDDATETDPNSQLLRTLLQAEQWNKRCHALNYFEVRLIETQISEANQKAPETAPILLNTAIEFEDRLAQLDTVLAELREAAATATQDAPCDSLHVSARAVRAAYAPPYLKMAIGASTLPEFAALPLGQRQAFEHLVTFMQRLYGSRWEVTVNTFTAELQADAGSWAAQTMWNALESQVQDINWQNRLAENGYTYAQESIPQQSFRPRRIDGSESLAMVLQHRSYQKVWLQDGWTDLYRALGRLDDGRLIVVLASHSKDNPAGKLRATLLMEDAPDFTAWNKDSWRTGATSFEAEQLAASACPLDYCFVFPPDVSARRAADTAKAGLVSYELYVGAPETYPLAQNEPSFKRTRVYSTEFSPD